MKRLSLQWRITLMSVLLIGITCVAMNLLLRCVLYGHHCGQFTRRRHGDPE